MWTTPFIKSRRISTCCSSRRGQADAITACFSEYSKQLLKRTKSAKAPIREQIKEAAAEAARQPAQKLERAKEAVHEDR